MMDKISAFQSISLFFGRYYAGADIILTPCLMHGDAYYKDDATAKVLCIVWGRWAIGISYNYKAQKGKQ